jgi:hypothetical protein
MSNLQSLTLAFALVAGIATVHAAELQLSLDIPACKMPRGKPLPAKYYAIAKKWKEYRWGNKVKFSDLIADGSGYERIDGSRMYNWHTFGKLDINGDGVCDWFLTSLAPYSTGGDSGVLNTLYFGTASAWRRVGAAIPNYKPDVLGAGNSSNEQSNFAWSSETPYVIRDRQSGTPYLIGYFASRSISGRQDHEGYHIYTWSPRKNTLQELDKWEPDSAAARVYAFFKQHGAADPTQTGADRIVHFDPEFEKSEFDRGCKDEEALKRSIHFTRACKSRNMGSRSQ